MVDLFAGGSRRPDRKHLKYYTTPELTESVLSEDEHVYSYCGTGLVSLTTGT